MPDPAPVEEPEPQTDADVRQQFKQELCHHIFSTYIDPLRQTMNQKNVVLSGLRATLERVESLS